MRINYKNGYYEGAVNYAEQEHGFGTFHWSDTGNSYTGEWVSGEMHGYGTYTFADGASCQGEFSHDKFCGRDRYKYTNGNVYEGEWQDDHYCGHGVLTQACGLRIEANWLDNSNAEDCTFTENGTETHGKIVDGSIVADE